MAGAWHLMHVRHVKPTLVSDQANNNLLDFISVIDQVAGMVCP